MTDTERLNWLVNEIFMRMATHGLNLKQATGFAEGDFDWGKALDRQIMPMIDARIEEDRAARNWPDMHKDRDYD